MQAGTGIQASPLPDYGTQFRTTGRQSRADRAYVSSWEFGDCSKGLGIKNMDVGNEKDTRSYYESHLWVHHPGQITLGPLFITPTIINAAVATFHKPTHLFSWKNNVYAVVQPSGAVGSALVYKYFAPSNAFASHSIMGFQGTSSGQIVSIREVQVFENDLYVADTDAIHVLGGIGSHSLVFPSVMTLGPAVQILPTGSLRKPWALLTGSNNCIPLVPSGTPTASVGSSGLRLENTPSVAFQGIPSHYDLWSSPMAYDQGKVYFAVPDGLYEMDQARCPRRLDTSSFMEGNPHMALYDNLLYHKLGKQLLQYNPDTNAVADKGYERRQGLPKMANEDYAINRHALSGEITALYSTYKYLFAAVHVGTGLQSLPRSPYVMLYDKGEDAWHYLGQSGQLPYNTEPGKIVNRMLISNAPDGAERLWFLYRDIGANHSNFAPSFIFNPLTNPLGAPTHAFATYGELSFPFFHGGLPEMPGAWLNIGMHGQIASTTLTDDFRADIFLLAVGTNQMTTYKVASINYAPYFGKIAPPQGGYGILANIVQPILALQRDANAATGPIVYSITLDYFKQPPRRMSYSFMVDIEATADKTQRPPERVIADIESARDYVGSMPVFWYGQVPTKTVHLLETNYLDFLLPQRDFAGERKSTIAVKLAELA